MYTVYALYLANVKFGELECKCKLVEIQFGEQDDNDAEYDCVGVYIYSKFGDKVKIVSKSLVENTCEVSYKWATLHRFREK